MPDPGDLLAFYAPELASLPAADINQALAIAVNYRPGGLPSYRQDEAQALYAAWLLTLRARSASGQTSVAGPVIAEKEGDDMRQYAQGIQGGYTLEGVGDYYARYQALVALSGRGAIITGQAYDQRCP